MKLFVIVAICMVFCRPNLACIPQPPTTPPLLPPPPPTSCQDAGAAVASIPGMAPLYGDQANGGNEYILVLSNDASCQEMMQEIKGMASSSRRITTMKAMESRSGVNAIVADLDREQLNEVRKMEGVKYVEKNGIATLSAFTDVWGLDRIDQRNTVLDNMYSPSGNGSGSNVYVIDTGVNVGIGLFEGRATQVYDPFNDGTYDCNGHGTHVAGTVGARTYGVATGVQIRSVRVFGCSDQAPIADIIAGINYIIDNGDNSSVVSMSLGAPASFALDDAVKTMANMGYIVVVAAGNADIDACGTSPARLKEVITVGATDRTDARSSFSNHGSGVEIFAPGRNIPSIHHITGGERILSGTSMATPHVSGVAAILLAQGTNTANVRQQIFDTSTEDAVSDEKGSHNRLVFID